MAIVRAFKAVHPASGYYEKIAALPYDVYSREEARAEAAKEPLSFLNIDRPETQFPPEQDMYAQEVYEKAAQMLQQEISDGYYGQDEECCYYLYELTMDGRSQTGIVACASVDDYVNGVIRKHENTREEKEIDRIRHVDTCSAQTGPIFLAYRKRQRISEITAEVKKQPPMFSFTSEDKITHRGWRIDDPGKIEEIGREFGEAGTLYIADGHHRAASAVKVGLKRRAQAAVHYPEADYNFFLSVIFPDEELMIMDYNRVVRDLNGMTTEDFLRKMEGIASLHPENEAVKPQQKGECGLCTGGQWYRLNFNEELTSEDPVEGLDVSVLQRYVLSPLLGIEDPRTDTRISFVGGIRGLGELERRVDGGEGAAFAMYPTSIAELFGVADANRLMPPKSTWFEPKLRSGLFIHLI